MNYNFMKIHSCIFISAPWRLSWKQPKKIRFTHRNPRNTFRKFRKRASTLVRKTVSIWRRDYERGWAKEWNSGSKWAWYFLVKVGIWLSGVSSALYNHLRFYAPTRSASHIQARISYISQITETIASILDHK